MASTVDAVQGFDVKYLQLQQNKIFLRFNMQRHLMATHLMSCASAGNHV